ncbi:MAG: ABC transporter ATP-binding protein, partial [Alphaproteobacteria bacterium]|nr:ABC transporter ATP-binding protein [Alphaproteobacteria bacterium]
MRTSLDAGTREPDRGLRPWFRIWHPRYRKLLLLLLAMAAAASCLDYGQNLALEALTRALGTTLARGEPDASQGLIGELGVRLGLTVPLLLLLSYFLISTLRLAVSYWNEHYTGRLDVESRSDLEQQMLLHLVRQDEAFFARCSPGEIVNRIGVDLGRALDRRTQVTGACWSAALLASNLAFFLARGWVLAAVALGACVAGTLLARRITRPIHELDRLHLEADDGVKATFEDLLGAAEEIRATNLFEPLGRAFGARLQARADIYRRYVRLNALLNLSQRGAAVLTVATMVLVAMSLGPEGAPASGLALIPVIIHVLPRLLANSADLVVHRLRLAMGTTSIERLLEYEAAMPPHAATQRGRGAEPDAPPLAPVPLAVAGATFRYTSADGALVGGISNVSVDIAPTGWLGLIGGAGSGKSTLLKLLIGQAAPQQGTVRIGDAPAHALSPEARARTFAYMPQRPTILDATIVENLLFGRGLMGAADGERLLSAADVALVER